MPTGRSTSRTTNTPKGFSLVRHGTMHLRVLGSSRRMCSSIRGSATFSSRAQRLKRRRVSNAHPFFGQAMLALVRMKKKRGKRCLPSYSTGESKRGTERIAYVIHAYAVSVVVPTYNEAGGIEKLIAALAGIFQKMGVDGEVVIVDDNSPDGTGPIVAGLASRYPCRCVHRSGKLGLASAVIDGWKTCASPILGVMDADFSHDIEIVPQLVGALTSGEYQLAIGSRYVRGGGITNWPWRRG